MRRRAFPEDPDGADGGMDLRDYFAIRILSAWIGDGSEAEILDTTEAASKNRRALASQAYEFAEVMLSVRQGRDT